MALVLLILLVIDAGMFYLAQKTKFDNYDYEKREQLLEKINNGEISPKMEELIILLKKSFVYQQSLHELVESQRAAIITAAQLLLLAIGLCIAFLYLLVFDKRKYNKLLKRDCQH